MTSVLLMGPAAPAWVAAMKALGLDCEGRPEIKFPLPGGSEERLQVFCFGSWPLSSRDLEALAASAPSSTPNLALLPAGFSWPSEVPEGLYQILVGDPRRDAEFVYRSIRQAQDVVALRRALAEAGELNAALDEAAKHREAFFEMSLDMLCIADFQGYFQQLNPAWLSLGYTLDELRAQPFLAFVHPDDVASTLEIMGQLTTSEYSTMSFENRYRCKDGSYRWLLWSSRTSHGAARTEDRLYFAVARDITQRKEREEALRTQTLALARSNADLQQFATIASHDLKEPLRMVSSYVALLEQRYKGRLDPEADRYIHFAVDGTQRMTALISDLLTFSRVSLSALAMRPVDLNVVLERVLRDLEPSVRQTQGEVVHGALPMAAGDAVQLGQVFLNLIGNALKFAREGVPPKVEISAERSGPFWKLSVRDLGIGIDADHFDRIFEIFQRLHGRTDHPGTGIGLAVVKRVVERHGGQVWAESVVGESTTFFLTLLAVEGEGTA